MTEAASGAISSVSPIAMRNPTRERWFLAALALGRIHGWYLALALPRTLEALWAALRPGGSGIPDREFWVFNNVDAGYRSWYDKLARDYAVRGRFGYAWDDGLGLPLGPRIYSNLATYWLLAKLGTRRMFGLAYLLMVLTVGAVCSSSFGVPLGIVAALLAAGSALVVIYLTYYSKPEFFSWWLAPVAIALAFHGQVLWGALVCSLLAWVCIPAAVLLGLMTGVAVLAHALTIGAAGPLFLGLVPGVAKVLVRTWSMARSGWLRAVVHDQASVVRYSWVPRPLELAWMVPFAGSLALSGWQGHVPGMALLLGLPGVAIYWANSRFLKMNDAESYHLAFFGISLGFACAEGSLLGAAASLFLAYTHPFYSGAAATSPISAQASYEERFRWLLNEMRRFPWLAPMAYLLPPDVDRFFGAIPSGARIIFESDGDPRTQSRMRFLYVWSDGLLPRRNIDLVTEEYARVGIPEFVSRYLTRFRAADMSGEEMAAMCRRLGISHAIAFTDDTVRQLETAGFRARADVDLADVPALLKATGAMPVRLTLLEAAEPTTVVGPLSDPALLSWRGSTLTWPARAGTEYQVRYRHYPAFGATQEGRPLSVEVYRPFPELTLEFMRVRARADGPITLRYRGGRA